jgi:hypothetical protein
LWDNQILGSDENGKETGLIKEYKTLVDEEYAKSFQNLPEKDSKKIAAAEQLKRQIEDLRNGNFKWYLVFDKDFLKNSLNLEGHTRIRYLLGQEIVLRAFKRIKPMAERLSELVRCSRVDTKKFGNDTATRQNFLNSLWNFIYKNSDVNFTLTVPFNGIPVGYCDNKTALQHYFEDTYLNDKLFTAVNMYDKILQS